MGVVATVAGAGTGLPHLAKAGWSPVAAAALLALVSGLVPMVVGAAVVVRRVRRWWRLVVAPAVLVGINALTYTVTDLLTAARPPITRRAAARAAAPRPVLLIAAGDRPDEGHAARHIQRGNAGVQVWKVPDTGHTRALFTHPDEWRQRVLGFLAAALPA